MSFNHTTVESVEAAHANAIERQRDYIESVTEGTDSDRVYKTLRDVDGIRVGPELFNLCESVRKIDPRMKFGIGPRCKKRWDGNVNIHCDIWAYVPEHEYALMRLGYGDFSVRGTGKTVYCVSARHVKNEKYREDRDEYSMVLSDSLERAVKNAKKYLRPYSVIELAGMSAGDFVSNVRESKFRTQSQRSSAYSAVCDDRDLLREMRLLVEAGHTFITQTFGDKVVAMLAAHDAQTAEENKEVHGHYVYVRTTSVGQVFDVLRAMNLRSHSMRITAEDVKTYTLPELPEDIAHKIASLSILDGNNRYVEGLGKKVSDKSYWVVD